MKLEKAILAALLLTLASAFAQGMPPSASAKAPASAATASKMPLVDGVVEQIDRGKGLLVLKHGDLPNLGMGPMTMGFEVADRKMLNGLKVGQRVKFQAEMVRGEATVTELKRVR